jgi:hypothetical protein
MTRVKIVDGKPVNRISERRRSAFDQQLESGNLTLRTDGINQDGKTVVAGQGVVLIEYVPMEPAIQGV